jgi:ATP-dependent DNA ligase
MARRARGARLPLLVLIERRRRSAARSKRTTPSLSPRAPGWVHEIKHDGFRMMVRRDAGVRLLTARDE